MSWIIELSVSLQYLTLPCGMKSALSQPLKPESIDCKNVYSTKGTDVARKPLINHNQKLDFL